MSEPPSQTGTGELAGKVALVTGGAGGLGSATARALAAAGARVVSRTSNPAGAGIAEEIGGLFAETDVSDARGQPRARRVRPPTSAEASTSSTSTPVSPAASASATTSTSTATGEVMGINLDGVVFGTVAALPALRERGGGVDRRDRLARGAHRRPLRPALRRQQARGRRSRALAGPRPRRRGHPLQRDLPGLRRVGDHRADPRGPGRVRERRSSPPRRSPAPSSPCSTGEMSGECWYVQAGREAEAFRFRNIPGPRAEDS